MRYFESELTMLCIFPKSSDTEDSMTTDYNLLASMLNQCLRISEPIVHVTQECKCYAQVPVYETGQFTGVYILGPVQTGSGVLGGAIVPRMAYSAFIAAVCLTYHYATGRILNESKIILSGTAKGVQQRARRSLNESLLASQELNYHHGTYEYEKFILRCIRNGDVKNLNRFSTVPYKGNIGLMVSDSRNALRQQKNILIAFVTMATRAAIEGGLNIEKAYTLSDIYIQQAENLTTVVAIKELLEKVLLEFTSRVNQSKMNSFSKPVEQCIDYIQNHIFEKIKIDAIANASEYNGNYLAHLFREETGYSIVDYINYQKCEEAKGLLQFSDHSSSEIASLLSFSSQSYFISLFKKFVGQTPKAYQLQNGRNMLNT